MRARWAGAAGAVAAALYAVAALTGPPARPGDRSRKQGDRPAEGVRGDAGIRPVTVLKPLRGDEPRLAENLATFCRQDHPRYQLLFSVSSSTDPAVGVVEGLRRDHPDQDIELVVDPRVHGTNPKVGNLVNSAGRISYDWIVLADSDIAVPPGYLRAVTAPLSDPRTGVVTCLYRARALGGVCSRLGSLFIDQWFAPSVRVAHAIGSRRFGFGATLAFRHTELRAAGGFMALRNCLADDYRLAELLRRRGLATVLSPVVVTTDVSERLVRDLWARETRWLRTIRSVDPVGFAFLPVTFTSPTLLLASWAVFRRDPRPSGDSTASAVSVAALAAGTAARLLLHRQASPTRRAFLRDLVLLPVRDLLLCAEWAAAAFGSSVRWKGIRIPVTEERS